MATTFLFTLQNIEGLHAIKIPCETIETIECAWEKKASHRCSYKCLLKLLIYNLKSNKQTNI
jgi:hypothetical protein